MVSKQDIFETYMKVRHGESLSIAEQLIYLIHIEGLTEEKAHQKIDLELFKLKNLLLKRKET
jgi:hypothetical protein